ncbi:MFS transporter [Pseudomaricurvus sp.]|uniref:MFS transporter n=1 Tax=Pseudomaricurvus sp. TaxID=2004510 RepID=UPI003F6B2480
MCAMLIAGCTSYIFGLFVIPVSTEFNLSRAEINNGYIAFLLGVGVLSPIVGRLLDKFSSRLVMGCGGILFGLGMLGIAHAQNPLLIIIYILLPVAFGMAACGTLAANTVVVRWFGRNRGKALGVLAISTSAGGFIFTPLTAVLIEQYGWRGALEVIGILAIVVIVFMTTVVIRNKPTGRERGYCAELSTPVGDNDPADDRQSHLWSYAELLKNRNFWLLTLGVGLLYSSDQAMVTSNVPYFQDIGIGLSEAALIASCMTASAIGGKMLVGFLADKVDLRHVFYVVAIAHIAILLVYLSQPPFWGLLILATIFGLGIGGVFPVWTTMLAWTFGSTSYGTIMGLMTIFFKLGSILTVRFVGEVFDATGSYETAFYVFIAMVVLAMVMVSMMKPQSGLPAKKTEPVTDTPYQATKTTS